MKPEDGYYTGELGLLAQCPCCNNASPAITMFAVKSIKCMGYKTLISEKDKAARAKQWVKMLRRTRILSMDSCCIVIKEY